MRNFYPCPLLFRISLLFSLVERVLLAAMWRSTRDKHGSPCLSHNRKKPLKDRAEVCALKSCFSHVAFSVQDKASFGRPQSRCLMMQDETRGTLSPSNFIHGCPWGTIVLKYWTFQPQQDLSLFHPPRQ